MTVKWTDHAAEARRCARKDTHRLVVSIVRYVARLSATIQTITHSKPRRTP